VENTYRGDIIIVNTRGEVTFSVGVSEKITYRRSVASQFKHYLLFIQEQQINID